MQMHFKLENVFDKSSRPAEKRFSRIPPAGRIPEQTDRRTGERRTNEQTNEPTNVTKVTPVICKCTVRGEDNTTHYDLYFLVVSVVYAPHLFFRDYSPPAGELRSSSFRVESLVFPGVISRLFGGLFWNSNST